MAKAKQQRDDEKEIKQNEDKRVNKQNDEEKEEQDNPLYGLSFGNAIKKITTDNDKQKSKK